MSGESYGKQSNRASVVRGAGDVSLRQLDEMTLSEIIEFVGEVYCTEALSNDEIFELAVSMLDGHKIDDSDPSELSFDV